MQLVKIESIGEKELYDITVDDNHEYTFANGVRTHNTGIMYSSNEVWIIGKAQEKEGTEVTGYKFTVRIEKSRRVKDKRSIPVYVSFNGGLSPVSGMFDIAKDLGYIESPSMGWFSRKMFDKDTGEIIEDGKKRRKDIEFSKEYFDELFAKSDFADAIKKHYCLPSGSLLTGDEEIEEETLDDIDNSEELENE